MRTACHAARRIGHGRKRWSGSITTSRSSSRGNVTAASEWRSWTAASSRPSAHSRHVRPMRCSTRTASWSPGPADVRTDFEQTYVAITHRPDRLFDLETTARPVGQGRNDRLTGPVPGLAWSRCAPSCLSARDRPAEDPLELVDRDDPEPADGELVLRVTACAVCRTDLQIVTGDLPPHRSPIIPGHQAVGVVTADRTGCRGLGSRRAGRDDVAGRLRRDVPILPLGSGEPLPVGHVHRLGSGRRVRDGGLRPRRRGGPDPGEPRRPRRGAAPVRRGDRLSGAATERHRARRATRPVRVRCVRAAGHPGGSPMGL